MMMMLSLKKLINSTLILFGVVILFINCNSSEYHKLVKTELAKNVQFDSLFFDIGFGERKDDYFDKIWELNKKGILFPAPGEYGTVRQVIKSDSSELNMDFFPGFNNKNQLNKIKLMFSNNGWALWNEELHSDKLIINILDSIKKWYPGNDFIQIKGEKHRIDIPDIFVKVDGNRQFKVYFMDNMKVIVDIENLNDK